MKMRDPLFCEHESFAFFNDLWHCASCRRVMKEIQVDSPWFVTDGVLDLYDEATKRARATPGSHDFTSVMMTVRGLEELVLDIRSLRAEVERLRAETKEWKEQALG